MTIAHAMGALTASQRVALPCCQDSEKWHHLEPKYGGSSGSMQRFLNSLKND